MTDRQKRIESITDSIYYYMVEIVSLADELETIGIVKEGDNLSSVADQIERVGIRLLNHKRHRRA